MKKHRTLKVLATAALLVGAYALADSPALPAKAGDGLVGAPGGKQAEAPPAPGRSAAIARGRYIAEAGDCVACHTVPHSGQPFAGGLALETPFGKLVASNITQDVKTGIGGWTEEEFTRAVRLGKGKHGQNLYSAMPYPAYNKVTDADMHDLWLYMQTIKPVSRQVESNQLPFPFNIRTLMWGWNLLFFDKKPFQPDSTQSMEWNRGAYLVEGLAHCAACHTAKNVLGGDSSKKLQGGTLQGWFAPEITGDKQHGLGAWSLDDTVTYLKTGANGFTVASGPMAEAVENSTQHMTTADLRAMAVYLKSLPGSQAARPAPVAANDRQMLLGAKVYDINCAACHASNGKGISSMVTALAGNGSIQAPVDSNLVNAILRGTRGAITHANPTGAAMPSFAWKLTDGQVAAVSTYIRNSWGNAASATSEGSVAKARKQLALPAQTVFVAGK